jgi:hypothetical protein
VVGAVTASLILDKDIASITDGALRAAFEGAFQTDVAATLTESSTMTVSSHQIVVMAISDGSLLIDFAVLPGDHDGVVAVFPSNVLHTALPSGATVANTQTLSGVRGIEVVTAESAAAETTAAPPPAPPPAPPTLALTLQVTVDKAVSDIKTGEGPGEQDSMLAAREAFEASFKEDVASMLNIDPSRVTILAIGGDPQVVVTFAVSTTDAELPNLSAKSKEELSKPGAMLGDVNVLDFEEKVVDVQNVEEPESGWDISKDVAVIAGLAIIGCIVVICMGCTCKFFFCAKMVKSGAIAKGVDACDQELDSFLNRSSNRQLAAGNFTEAFHGATTWAEKLDRNSNRNYYINAESGESSWTRPQDWANPWSERWDASTNRTYYINRETKESSWVKPPGANSAIPEGAQIRSGTPVRSRP